MTREQVVKAYEDYGWTKRLEFDWIVVDRRGRAHKRRLHFNADTMNCDIPEDVQHMLSFVQLRPTGVIWTCGVCGKSDGPIAEETGRIVSDTEITFAEAWQAIKLTGQKPPVGLDKPSGRRGRVRIVG